MQYKVFTLIVTLSHVIYIKLFTPYGNLCIFCILILSFVFCPLFSRTSHVNGTV